MGLYVERDGIFKSRISEKGGYVICFFDKAVIETLEKVFMAMRLSVEPHPVGGITNKQWKDAIRYDKTRHQEFIEECDEREIKINSMICDIIGVQSANFHKISQLSGRASINKDTNIEAAEELAKFKLMNKYAKSVICDIKKCIKCYYPEVAKTTESKVTINK